ncbi:MAG: hypothetical protein ABJB01_02005 [Rudaea sp.]
MNRNSLTTAVIAGIAGVAGIANMASAVNLNPDGLGQVLLYPYYTVNGGQSTLLSVVNTTAVGKAVKVRFLEGYNSREVLDFNLFLSPFDVWTADIFALSDFIGASAGDGAAIFTRDNSCTAPVLSEGTFANGVGYVAFRDYTFSGTNSDTGPTDISRTREGHFEMISMGNIVAGSALDDDTTHDHGVPPGCGTAGNNPTPAEADFEANDAVVAPTSGLFGSAEVVDTANGTYYTYNADAINGFTATAIISPTNNLTPNLAQANDPASTDATSYVFDEAGNVLTSTYTSSNAIDAVSSIFMSENVYNEYVASASGNGTDWVLNFPTKRFYVDATINSSAPIQPFEHAFGAEETGNALGLSCTVIGITIYDREENTSTPSGCGFSPCPPGQPPSSLCHETNVITFNSTGTNSILSSTLTANIKPIGTSGWAGLNMDPPATGHTLRAATNLNVFHGLPVSGFAAVNFVVGSGTATFGNYSGVNRHRIDRLCTNSGGACS